MSIFDSFGVKTVDELVVKIKPLSDDWQNRISEIVRENLDRFNGATLETQIVDGKIINKLTLTPVAPPAVSNG